MDESNNHYFISINNTIRGTYDNTNIYSYNYIEEIKNTINYLLYNKIVLEENIKKIENSNNVLLRDIKLLDKICCLNNVTHNNTINFIIKNYSQIKFSLDRSDKEFLKKYFKIMLKV
jgi:hypothetical protein